MKNFEQRQEAIVPGLGRILIGLVVGLLILMLTQLVHAEGGGTQKKLAFDTTASGTEIREDVAQLPLLMRLHSGNFKFAEAKPDGSDLRVFAADGKTPLKFHIENFDVANELANIWVGLPKLTANSKTDSIVVAWGSPKAVAAVDVAGTYDAEQIFVLHFGDADGVRDATVNGNHARASNTKPVAAGPIGPAMGFDGSARVEMPSSASLKIAAASGFTFSAWIKPAGNDNALLYVQRDGNRSLSIGLTGGVLYAGVDNNKASAASALVAGNWQNVAVVAAAGKVTFFVDGNEAGGGALALVDMAGEATLGQGLQGQLDEAALAGVARSASYIKAMASSQGADTPMLAFGDDAGGGDGVSHFAILLGAVTIDGWVIIALLMVMAVVSFYVMISKAMTLSAIGKANAAFLETFRNKPTELLTPKHEAIVKLSADPRLKRSTIYHLYKTGLHEVAHRFEAQARSGVPHNLSAAGLDSIRASLDAAIVREMQRLNSGIVLLTIAISGGPFLGLLGTVVGVMITFAAIAAAGDVNVNAIAPGIAAALVATVAGLAVAIPALFGYNWLAIQIKNVSADTQVFADEFLTRAAELHSV